MRYALINKRDTATSKALFRSLGTDSLNIQINLLQEKLEVYLDSVFKNDAGARRKFFAFSNTLFTDKAVPFDGLDTAFQAIVKRVAKDPALPLMRNLIEKKPRVNLATESRIHFTDLKRELQTPCSGW